MFKQTVAVGLVVISTLAIDERYFEKPHATIIGEGKAGVVVAFHENEFQKYAIDLLVRRDKLEQWSCLYTLWMRESNWNPRSRNKESGAYGIAQFMPETWALVGHKKTSDGFKQIEAGLDYIDRKWGGNICKALGSNLARGWY